VYGYPSGPARDAAVISAFQHCGKIEDVAESQGNWVFVKFASPLDAERAARMHGKLVNSGVMVAVERLTAHRASELNLRIRGGSGTLYVQDIVEDPLTKFPLDKQKIKHRGGGGGGGAAKTSSSHYAFLLACFLGVVAVLLKCFGSQGEGTRSAQYFAFAAAGFCVLLTFLLQHLEHSSDGTKSAAAAAVAAAAVGGGGGGGAQADEYEVPIYRPAKKRPTIWARLQEYFGF